MKWTKNLKLSDDELLRYAYLSEDDVILRLAGVVDRVREEVLSEVVELTSELNSANNRADKFEELYLKSQSERELKLEEKINRQRQRETNLYRRISELEDKLDTWTILVGEHKYHNY